MTEVKQEEQLGVTTANDWVSKESAEAAGTGPPGAGAEIGTDPSNTYGEADVVNIPGSQGVGMEHATQPEPLQQSDAPHSNDSLTREQLVQTFMEGFPMRVSSRHQVVALNAVCQVEGCGQRLCFLKEYHQRYRVCVEHLKCESVYRSGRKMRFCQQCGKFQDLELFDEGKRSCRERLKKHNERRRKRVDARYAAAVMLQMTEGADGGIAGEELARRTAHPGQRDGRKRPPPANPGNSQMGSPFHPSRYETHNSPPQYETHNSPPQYETHNSPPLYGAPHRELQYPRMPQVSGTSSMPPMPYMPTAPPASTPSHNATPIEHGMDMISELVSYMMAVRSLSTITTDLETDVPSQTSIGMVNMALNVNIMPKVVPGPRTMELLLRNFASAFQYDLTSLSMRPISIVGSSRGAQGVDTNANPHARMGADLRRGQSEAGTNGERTEAGTNGERTEAGTNGNGQRVRRRIKRPKKLRDFEDPDWPEGTEGLEDLMNFASEAGSE